VPESPRSGLDAGELHALVAARDWPRAVQLAAALHPSDLADELRELPSSDRIEFLGRLPSDIIAGLFGETADADLPGLAREVGLERLPSVLDEAGDHVAADVIQHLEPGEQERTLDELAEPEGVAELLRYGPETAGGIMRRDFVAVRDDKTAGEAIDDLRLLQPAADRTYYIYAVDSEGRLTGVLSLRDLIVAQPTVQVAEIASHDVRAVDVTVDQEEAARTLQRYGLRALPVVSGDGVLAGVITAEDVVDVVQEEATEDMYRMVGLEEQETVLSPVRKSLRRRIPWLMVNLATAFLAALVVAPFEGTIERVGLLAAFMPIIAGHAGNTGTQVATLVVRGIALGEVSFADAFTIIRKEVAFGVVHGALAGTLTAALAIVLSLNPWLGGVVMAALVLNVILAGVMGAVIPLGIKRLGGDPALAAAIWLTTITDVLGFLMLLGFGALLVSRLS
jgi:magnesium transporter